MSASRMPTPETPVAQGDGKVGRDGRFSDTALARSDRYDVGYVARHGRFVRSLRFLGSGLLNNNGDGSFQGGKILFQQRLNLPFDLQSEGVAHFGEISGMTVILSPGVETCSTNPLSTRPCWVSGWRIRLSNSLTLSSIFSVKLVATIMQTGGKEPAPARPDAAYLDKDNYYFRYNKSLWKIMLSINDKYYLFFIKLTVIFAAY